MAWQPKTFSEEISESTPNHTQILETQAFENGYYGVTTIILASLRPTTISRTANKRRDLIYIITETSALHSR